MKRNQLSHFKAQAISVNFSSQLLGGTSFCDWYMNLCASEGRAVDQRVLDRFMRRDGRNNNTIPSWVDMSRLLRRVRKIEAGLI